MNHANDAGDALVAKGTNHARFAAMRMMLVSLTWGFQPKLPGIPLPHLLKKDLANMVKFLGCWLKIDDRVKFEKSTVRFACGVIA